MGVSDQTITTTVSEVMLLIRTTSLVEARKRKLQTQIKISQSVVAFKPFTQCLIIQYLFIVSSA